MRRKWRGEEDEGEGRGEEDEEGGKVRKMKRMTRFRKMKWMAGMRKMKRMAGVRKKRKRKLPTLSVLLHELPQHAEQMLILEKICSKNLQLQRGNNKKRIPGQGASALS